MLWELEIHPRGEDREVARVAAEYALLTHTSPVAGLVTGSAHGYLLEGDLDREQAQRLTDDLLLDAVAEEGKLGALNEHLREDCLATVLYKPGVMDPAALSILDAARDLRVPVSAVRTFRRYFGPPLDAPARAVLFRKVLANDAVEQVVAGPLALEHLTLGGDYTFRKVVVPLRALDDAGLERLSKEGQLALTLPEMQTIQQHFRDQGRDPTDVELETLAQTWSEHCSHKTLKGIIDFTWEGEAPAEPLLFGSAGASPSRTVRITNLLKQTIFGATQQLRQEFGEDDWCVSVFVDNAGVVQFDDRYHVCFKVETHNRPSAIEPYGGANTGLGGVIRDLLGTGLGARPVCNTDVFCFAPPDTAPETLPPGVLHPRKIIQGVVTGVKDYGNRMGIPTVNGAVCFSERYLGNPLVFCGTIGLLPVDRVTKAARAGDLIVALGGRTGRDGIHGATFSSLGLSQESETVGGGAVQIGNAIEEKKLLDVLLVARDRGLYHAVTDCGAGGFSSAVGEMGADLGASVQLEQALLKYEGLSYAEIWISESQERMVLAVAPGAWPELQALCASENVEAFVLGTFEATGKLRLSYRGEAVGELDMHFLHEGRPAVVRQATWSPPALPDPGVPALASTAYNDLLLRALADLDVCSKEWIIRQYDHEVQGGSVLKPLVGVGEDGPGDAAVVMPVLGGSRGIVVGCGINIHAGDLDPYRMAALAIDEAVRNVVAVGADPSRIALLDNFCWGRTDRPETLGSLVLAAQACRDVSLAYKMPFISGKDSLNNEFAAPDRHIAIPPTLLISALGQMADVRRCVSMDLKEPGNLLFLVGTTTPHLGGSLLYRLLGLAGGEVPMPDLSRALVLFARLSLAINGGLVRSCHDLSEGGLAVALAEMAFAGGVGADVTSTGPEGLPDAVRLFAEAPTRFVVEVRPGSEADFRRALGDIPLTKLGVTVREPRLRIAGASGEWLVWQALPALKEAWQKPLRW
jgi:phosphoribosylformylglycinamidine synthase